MSWGNSRREVQVINIHNHISAENRKISYILNSSIF
jgi:hypothetical protein